MNVSAGPPVGPLHDQQEKVPSHLVLLLIAQLQAPLPASVGSTCAPKPKPSARGGPTRRSSLRAGGPDLGCAQ